MLQPSRASGGYTSFQLHGGRSICLHILSGLLYTRIGKLFWLYIQDCEVDTITILVLRSRVFVELCERLPPKEFDPCDCGQVV